MLNSYKGLYFTGPSILSVVILQPLYEAEWADALQGLVMNTNERVTEMEQSCSLSSSECWRGVTSSASKLSKYPRKSIEEQEGEDSRCVTHNHECVCICAKCDAQSAQSNKKQIKEETNAFFGAQYRILRGNDSVPFHPISQLLRSLVSLRVFGCHTAVIDRTLTCLAAFPVSGEFK